MSLVVWLPLTKDLRQQGLNNITVTTANTNNFQNEGKLSNKSLDVSGHYAFRVPSLVKKRVFSCAFWYKPITDSSLSDNWRRIVVFDTYTSDGSTTGALFRFESSYGYQSSNTTYCISIHNNAGEPIASIGTGLGETNGWNKWQHIAITADGTTLKCYRNGVQVASGNMGNGGMLQGTVHIGHSGNRPIGRLNDFRLYDHCLSPMEVKELAKGLVLHYPLNRQGWGQENLLPISGSTIIDSTQSFEFQGWVQNFYTKTWMNEHLTPGKQYTLSYTVTCLSIPDSTYTFKENRASPILVHQGGGWSQITTTSDGIKDTNMSVGQSRDYKCTFTFATATENYEYYGLCGYTALYRNSSNNTQYAKFRIDNLKLEEGSVPTPWCPNSSDALATTMGLNSTTEYDCSGFCNNGTRTGTFTWTSDTPKYSVSTQFNGTQVIQLPFSCSVISEAITVACWGYESNWNTSSAERLIGAATNSSGWCIGDYGSENTLFAFYANGGYNVATGFKQLTAGWHHFVITFDGLNLKYYVNGQQFSSKTFSTKQVAIGNYNIEIGRHYGDGCNFKGRMSDVRIYATALSADDVKSLYQNSAYIDSSGNVYGAVHSEV